MLQLLVLLRLRFLWEFAASLDRGQGGAYRKYDVSKVLKVLFCSLPMMLLKVGLCAG